ncbi:DUF1449 domain-containing protein [Streptomyces macrosporus]|uniref:DUF1449 family protein n=1 Tax=Streptomyces macrosporus TaxID=44032 RepID=A0ABN3JTY5_9ACTN
MSEFLRVALDFPAVLFGFGLLVVLAYWLSVLVGAVGADVLDGGEDIGADAPVGGVAGVFAAAGLGGAPVAVTLSLLVVIAWFVSLSGAALPEDALARALVLPVALVTAWAGTRPLIRPLRRWAPRETGIGRRGLVGRTCTIRTGHVSHRFGQAEITADDGSTVLVQVRAQGADAAGLAAGRTALVFDHDAEGGFFRVAPWDPARDPGRPAR